MYAKKCIDITNMENKTIFLMLLDLLQNVAGKTFMYHTYNISTLIVWYNITL